jgi:hypothetical protein
MKPLTDHEYVKAHRGLACPNCLSNDIVAIGSKPLRGGADVKSHEMSCENCGASWDDVYRLEGYQDLKDEDGNDIEPKELEALAEGFHEFLLDELVHDMKSEEATAINNRGSRAQLEYLLASGMSLEQIGKKDL